MAETFALAEVPQRVASPCFRAPTSASTHGGDADAGASNGRSITPPLKAVRVTRSYPTPGDAAHAPRTIIVTPGDSYHRRSSFDRAPRRQRNCVARW